jgi:uncharacterized membrane protein
MKIAEKRPVWQYGDCELDDRDFGTAMVHLYRAEVTRANVWRNRLDTTTNWAVVTVGAALTFLFSSPDHPHFILLLVLLLVLTFMLIEARRYSYYALWYHRVRLLETGFLSAMIIPPYAPAEDWGGALADTLRNPAFPIPRWRAAANRYRRNYVWLVSLLLISWFLKLSVHPTTAGSLQHVIDRASIAGWVPGLWVMGTIAILYVALLGLIGAMYLIPYQQEGRPRAYFTPPDGQPIKVADTQMAIIVTNRRDEISARLMRELERGVTAVRGTGMYTGTARDVLFCALTAAQEPQLRAIVTESDPTAFVILTGARDIRGRGFAPTEPPS